MGFIGLTGELPFPPCLACACLGHRRHGVNFTCTIDKCRSPFLRECFCPREVKVSIYRFEDLCAAAASKYSLQEDPSGGAVLSTVIPHLPGQACLKQLIVKGVNPTPCLHSAVGSECCNGFAKLYSASSYRSNSDDDGGGVNDSDKRR